MSKVHFRVASGIAFCFAMILGSSQIAQATTIDPLMWQQMVLGSEFVGIVECTTAGGVVARYKVIESWKGPKAGPKTGNEVALRIPVNYWGPQFATTLCGQRYLVTAYKSPPSKMMSTTSGGGVPLWWRNIPSDYRLPLFQGTIANPEKANRFFDSPHKDLKSFRQAAKKLIALSAADQEKILIQALIKKYLFGQRGGRVSDPKTLSDSLKTLKKKLGEVDSAGDMVRLLLEFKSAESRTGNVIASVLRQGGGTETLKVLDQFKDKPLPFNARAKTYALNAIHQRLGTDKPKPGAAKNGAKNKPPAPAPALATAGEIAQWKQTFAKGPKERVFYQALEKLTVHEPQPVRQFLIGWQNPAKSWRDAGRGYVLGSYFAWRCGKDRAKHLKGLDQAKDPFIRVAGAVYLCFEDKEAGIKKLGELSKLPGDPGTWAAINLVRRGNKEAMARALEVYANDGKSNMEGVPHRNLQKRLLVLLSNSAQSSGVEMPHFQLGGDDGGKPIKQWWSQVKSKIKLHDPWLELLEKQKVD
jgi:hypothetical protein